MSVRRLMMGVPAAALLLGAIAPAAQEAPPERRPEAAEVAAAYGARHAQPGMALAVFNQERIISAGVWGRRSVIGEAPLSPDDPVHVGSCAKAMTAMMIASVVDEGALWWEITLAEALPALAEEMHEDYRSATLANLLNHRAGVPAFMDGGAPEFVEKTSDLEGSPMEQRLEFARRVLREPPASKPGGQFLYSNAGYAIAAAIAEQKTGRSWEELLPERVFGPIGMDSAGFGWPATPDNPDGVLGHIRTGDALMPLPVNHPYRMPLVLAPSGDVHCTIGDLALFAQANLAGIRGRNPILNHKTWLKMHEPVGQYGMGWVAGRRGEGQTSWHNGSMGTFFALMTLDPDMNIGVVAVTNAGTGEQACQDATRALLGEYAPR